MKKLTNLIATFTLFLSDMKHRLCDRNKPHWYIIVEGRFLYGGNWTYKEAQMHAYKTIENGVVYYGGPNFKLD